MPLRSAASLSLLLSLVLAVAATVRAGETREVTPVGPHARLTLLRGADNRWGLAVSGAGAASVREEAPVCLELYRLTGLVDEVRTGYDAVQVVGGTQANGSARIAGPDGTCFDVTDAWTVEGGVLRLSRQVVVHGVSPGGFASGVSLAHPETHGREEVDYFAPGVLYGGTEGLLEAAIGGPKTYTSGQGIIQLREDRLPAPAFGVRFADGSALTVLDPTPDGATTREDSHEGMGRLLVDERLRFGAVGVRPADGHQAQGFWFPGSEGDMSYNLRPFLAPDGPVGWSRRFHPIREGAAQTYRVDFRFSEGETFPAYVRNAWRWASDTLHPTVAPQDLTAVRHSVVDRLASLTRQVSDRTGLPNYTDALTGGHDEDRRAVMGFLGKNLEAAEFLLADADLDPNPARAAHDRQLGLGIFASFGRLKLDPPAGEGFNLDTGEPVLALPRDGRVYLRSFGDDLKAALRAYFREARHGRTHPEWLAWTRSFGDWLLTQQQENGSFPRSWRPGSGEVADPSPQSSYNPVPFLVLLSRATGNPKYLEAASQAADFCWSHGQSEGRFVGGTIDNPNVLDKEAATLSLEGYAALYDATHDERWLTRACAAADAAETWIYLWNVPMPADEDDAALPWKRGATTVGAQLISTGHSATDEYMAFDADVYARLARWTHDDHYLRVAGLLLHNTKAMTAIPGRTYDLRGPGWQQEHWTFAPARGFGNHRGWLPWVATSQLKGIFGLMEFDPELYERLAMPPPVR